MGQSDALAAPIARAERDDVDAGDDVAEAQSDHLWATDMGLCEPLVGEAARAGDRAAWSQPRIDMHRTRRADERADRRRVEVARVGCSHG